MTSAASLLSRVFVTLLGASLAIAPVGCDSDGAGTSGLGPVASSSTSQEPAVTHSLIRASESGVYRVEIRPEDSSPRSTLHSWLVRISAHDGGVVRPSRLAFSGGMPQHGHGFPTAPHVTDALDDGWFRVSGIRFHMAGEWTVRVEFVGPTGPDVAIFQVDVSH